MARSLSDITTTAGENGAWRAQINTSFPTADFTLCAELPCARVQVNGEDLRQVATQRDFQEGTFLVEGKQTVLAFALNAGETSIHITSN